MAEVQSVTKSSTNAEKQSRCEVFQSVRRLWLCLDNDTLEKVYADVFCAEDALVRPQITCGTHALALALMSNLRPGDELLSPVGKPYDTLEEVIGIRPSKGSLAEYGISYRRVDLLEDGNFDFENIKKAINDKTKLVTIQRSKGYQTRPTLSVDWDQG